ncbi:hypothetical protein FJ875_09985 [Salmonella enterica]|nr:hypothetical protein [Salmonella enterica]EBS2907423.1 hypothetical protein [Salmonella enterica subsp. enterica serovar Flottbek]EHT1530425.1 hypothetical protein [Salmonella enterica subsp. enterica serovar Enteritidis]
MTTNNSNTFIFNHSVDIPASVAPHVWAAWDELMSWQRWDVSLKGTDAVDNGLVLGKRFAVIPNGGPGAIAVNVTALVEGTHFTTTAISPMGLLSFGHTLTLSEDRQSVQLLHSICVIPTENGTAFPPPLLEKLRADVIDSVQRLATLAIKEARLV